MRYEHALKQILEAARDHWDRTETRPAVRENFDNVTRCRTLSLGAEVFASETEQKIVPHTCKSRACPSCGHRATTLWQREQWAALPDVPYVGINFTMPDVFWPLFQQNRHLLHDLPALAAAVIREYLKARYGVRGLVIVVPHTFGRRLNFNSHLHTLVSAGGLRNSDGRWVPNLQFDQGTLMRMWRYAIVTYLRQALNANVLNSNLDHEQLKVIFAKQNERWWNIHVARFTSKAQFLRYAGRYIRRLPIAQHRIVKITGQEVEFLRKDLKLKQWVLTRYPINEFVSALAAHVPDRYRHAIRYFGLLAPRSKHQTSDALFALLGQKKRARPVRLGWAASIRKDFGRNPLLDSKRQPMRWVSRIAPQVV